jgi:hypothetical protein
MLGAIRTLAICISVTSVISAVSSTAIAQTPAAALLELPRWTFRGGTVILTRENPNNYALITDAATGAELLNMGNFNFDWAAGPDLSAWCRLDEFDQFELRHFSVWDCDASQSLVAPGAFIAHFASPSVAPIGGTGELGYDSRVFSTELNFRRQLLPRVQWLAGFRWIELREDLNANFLLPAVSVNSALGVHTQNDLYGGQLGLDVALWDRGGPFRLEGLIKSGIYGNAITSTTLNVVTDSVNPPSSRGIYSRSSQVAYIGELALTSVYRFSDALSLRLGYQLLWIEGVATASDQPQALNFDTLQGIDTTGHAFYHGATVGLEFRR